MRGRNHGLRFAIPLYQLTFIAGAEFKIRQRNPLNSSTVSPACRMMPRNVPCFRSRAEWQGTTTVRIGSPGYLRT